MVELRDDLRLALDRSFVGAHTEVAVPVGARYRGSESHPRSHNHGKHYNCR